MRISNKSTKVFQGCLLVCALIFPVLVSSAYIIHIIILIFIWAFIATSWSYMGRFGLVSLGHGAFMGIGAYTTSLLFNYYNLSSFPTKSGLS